MEEQVMLITGTSRGIGEALAKYYLSKQYLVIGCSRSKSGWFDKKDYPNYRHFVADVKDETEVEKIFRYVRRDIGRLDCLINNAGCASMNHSLLTPASAIYDVFGTNVAGTFLFCREAAKMMRRNSRGRIVNFSTLAVPRELEGESIYAASKAAVVMLTRVLAKEYAQYHITVNAIGPSPIKTSLISGVSEDKINKLLSEAMIHTYGTYEDVENVIDFFLKPESDAITGQIIYLGGW